MIRIQDSYFSFRIVGTGERYGLDNCLVNHDPAMVEIFDTRYDNQFVSRYFVATFLGIVGGLNMCGGIPAWILSESEVNAIQTILHNAGF